MVWIWRELMSGFEAKDLLLILLVSAPAKLGRKGCIRYRLVRVTGALTRSGREEEAQKFQRILRLDEEREFWFGGGVRFPALDEPKA